MPVFVMNPLCVGKFLRLNGIFHRVKIHTGIFLHCSYHGHALKRLAKVYHFLAVRHGSRAAHFFRHMAEHIFRQIHHTVIIRICLIEFHQGKFRIMSCIQTFVTEYTSDFVDSLHSAHNQSFQIQFQRNTKLYVLVQRIIMRFKRSCRRTARIGHKHWRLDLQETLSIQIASDRTDNLGT